MNKRTQKRLDNADLRIRAYLDRIEHRAARRSTLFEHAPGEGRRKKLPATNKEMIARLKASGHIASKLVEAAFKATDRKLFFPKHLDDAEAYEHTKAYQLIPGERKPTSTITSAETVALAVEMALLRRGHCVGEAGAGSGYQAHVASKRVGPLGSVVSVELHEGIAENASALLQKLGARNVRVVHGDAFEKFSEPGARFHRIIAAAGLEGKEQARELAKNLVMHGIIVAPIKRGRDYLLTAFMKIPGEQLGYDLHQVGPAPGVRFIAARRG